MVAELFEAAAKIVEQFSQTKEVITATKESGTAATIAHKNKFEQFLEKAGKQWEEFENNHPNVAAVSQGAGKALHVVVEAATSKTGTRAIKLVGAGLAAAALAATPAGWAIGGAVIVGATTAVAVGVVLDTNKAIRLDNLKEEKANLEQLGEVSKEKEGLVKTLDPDLAEKLGVAPKAQAASATTGLISGAEKQTLAPKGLVRSALKSFRDRFAEDAFSMTIAVVTGDVAAIAITAVGVASAQLCGAAERKEADETKKELKESVADLRNEHAHAPKDPVALKQHIREETIQKETLQRFTSDEKVKPLLANKDLTPEQTKALQKKFEEIKAEVSKEHPEVKAPTRLERAGSYLQKMGQVVKENSGKFFSSNKAPVVQAAVAVTPVHAAVTPVHTAVTPVHTAVTPVHVDKTVELAVKAEAVSQASDKQEGKKEAEQHDAHIDHHRSSMREVVNHMVHDEGVWTPEQRAARVAMMNQIKETGQSTLKSVDIKSQGDVKAVTGPAEGAGNAIKTHGPAVGG